MKFRKYPPVMSLSGQVALWAPGSEKELECVE